MTQPILIPAIAGLPAPEGFIELLTWNVPGTPEQRDQLRVTWENGPGHSDPEIKIYRYSSEVKLCPNEVRGLLAILQGLVQVLPKPTTDPPRLRRK